MQAAFIANRNTEQAGGTMQIVAVNLLAGARREMFEGRAHLVVPVIMLRADVPMKNALVPADEIQPWAWNGVPVTVGHPVTADGSYFSANTPEGISKWTVGRIFNAQIVGGIKLKAEAWIEMGRANSVRPGLIAMLEGDTDMDVSTGYFTQIEPLAGNVNGKPYEVKHRNLNPDHLALLPDDIGACSFEDGCGVRANQKGKRMSKLDEAFATIREGLGFGQNARGRNDEPGQMCADLIADEESPFLPEDMEMLRYMRTDLLKEMRDKFLSQGKGKEPHSMSKDSKERAALVAKITANSDMKEDDLAKMDDATLGVIANGLREGEKADPNAGKAPQGGSGVPEKQPAANAADSVANMKVTDLAALISETVNKAVPAYLAEQERPQLVAKVVANTDITEDAAKAMDIETLRTVANGVKPSAPPARYGGRALPQPETNDAERFKDHAVSTNTVAERLKELNGKGKEASA